MQPETNEDTLVKQLCDNYGVTEELREAARCNETDKSLVMMVLNHSAMQRLLDQLGYSSKMKVVVLNNMEVPLETVLRTFEWSFETYRHKVKWYSWAEGAAWTRRDLANGIKPRQVSSLLIMLLWSPFLTVRPKVRITI